MSIQNNVFQKEYEYYDRLHREKYRDSEQTHLEHSEVFAYSTRTDAKHEAKIADIVSKRRFLPAGRVQAALGATEREVSAFNCAVSQTIEDSLPGIMQACSIAASVLRLGTGIGYNFSTLRPKGALVKKLQTQSTGPVSFMRIFDVMAGTIASSGHRRGAQMGILNIDHPDIEEFIDSKMQKDSFRQFNISVGVSDKFMQALKDNADWDLQFEGKIYKTVKASYLWNKIMNNAYMSAEPGVVFLDQINKFNNLYYCETIAATNPCAEEPLPPNGLCLLGSFNLPEYLFDVDGVYQIDYKMLKADIRVMVEAYDNIFERSVYAIPEHKEEALKKRRMGLGYTGIANAIERIIGRSSYGEPEFNEIFEKLAAFLRDECYIASTDLAMMRGTFPLYNREKYLASEFVKRLPEEVKSRIKRFGMRNSHLLSYAPCGTISQVAGNVSSGVEPVFYHQISREVFMRDGKEQVTLMDYNFRLYGLKGKTLNECSVDEHLAVTKIAQQYCDSAVSKTINVAESCSYEDYQRIYLDAYERGSKGITVFRPTPLRGAVITEAKEPSVIIAQKDIAKVRYGESGSCANGMCSL